MINPIKPNISNNLNVFTPFNDKDGVKYAISKPFSEEAILETKKHKEAKSNALGYSIAATSLVVGFGVFAMMKGLPKGARIKTEKFFRFIDKKLVHLKEKAHLSDEQKFYIATLEKLKKLSRFSNGVFNITSIKDATFKAGTNKIPIAKKACDNITNFFRKISIKTSRNAYANTMSKFDDMYATFAEANTKLSPTQKLKVNQLLDNSKTTYQEVFTSTPRAKRLNKTKADLNGLHEKVRNRIFKVKELVKDKDTYTTFISEELASTAKTKLQNSVNPSRNIISKNVDEILSTYKEALPEKEFLKLQKQANKAIKSLDKSINIETDKLFDKMRDLEIGSAPTDILGVVASLGVIGWGLTKSDDKDERISVTLKSGIPVLGAMLTSLYCTVGLVSGGTALVLGLISGAAINKIGVAVDNYRKNYKENPTILPELDLSKLTLNPKK